MNRITAALGTTRYVREPHLILMLDGIALDTLLDAVHPEIDLLGLVASLDGLCDARDEALVWSRILPEVDQATFAPVLVCPDDLDLACSVVVADVFRERTSVSWRRLGLQRGGTATEAIVDWFEGIGPFAFDVEEYVRCLDAFRRGKT